MVDALAGFADQGIAPALAHNAVVALVEMYRAALDQSARREKLLLMKVAQLSAELEALKKDSAPNATRAPQGG